MHYPYETSHRTSGTKRNNWEAFKSGNITRFNLDTANFDVTKFVT